MKTVGGAQRGFGALAPLFLAVLLVLLATVGWVVYQHQVNAGATTTKHQKRGKTPLMILEYHGGLCDNGGAGSICHSEYGIYADGTFENHKALSISEVNELQKTIADTDFLAYKAKTLPYCQSYVDGKDEVLVFPLKYPGKSFTLCELEIPAHDQAIEFINGLIESHPAK